MDDIDWTTKDGLMPVFSVAPEYGSSTQEQDDDPMPAPPRKHQYGVLITRRFQRVVLVTADNQMQAWKQVEEIGPAEAWDMFPKVRDLPNKATVGKVVRRRDEDVGAANPDIQEAPAS